jgi:predicted nucleic acid-binding protein
VTLADTSAWIGFLRGADDPATVRMRALIASGSVATTEPVVMELLAGARSIRRQRQLRRLLAIATLVRVADLGTWERAGSIFRSCRAAGVSPRSQLDCLVAAVAIREDLAVLHSDRDFDRIAACVPLRIDSVD